MKRAGLILLSMVVIAAAPTPSEARHYRHHHCGAYDDYTHSNQLSSLSYIFPAANWGPFFHCRMYVSPVVTLQPLQY
jgi:hypothetical protein